jgi:hypothetical protein
MAEGRREQWIRPAEEPLPVQSTSVRSSSRVKDNPLVWMIEVNGIVVDVRMMPREFQEEAHRLGLIPFMPV